MEKPPTQGDPIVFNPADAGGRWLVIVGVLGTAIYFWWLWSYAAPRSIMTLKPEQLGTFIGGVVGPLAFGWLVLGFFQQGIELRHSARALWLQSEELRHSVEQQKALVDVTREQFEYERQERRKAEEEAERLARPNIGVQSNGSITSGGARRYEFLLANAGAMVTSVRLTEGSMGFGEAATWGPSTGLTVTFTFEPGEELRSRTLTIEFNDARGTPTRMELLFPAVEHDGRALLVAPQST